MYISSYLAKMGIDTQIIDIKATDPIMGPDNREKEDIAEEILAEIFEKKPKYVGLPCCSPEFSDVIYMSKRVKEKLPQTKVVVGGTHSTLFPEQFFFPNSPIDYAVVGEGEITTHELIEALEAKKNIQKIAGLVYYDNEQARIIKTEPRPYIQDLDSLPYPDFEKVDMDYYTTPNPYSVRGVMLSSFYILSGRGCPSSCTFCVSKNLRKIGSGRYLRLRSAKNVVDEMEYLAKTYKIDGFYIIDDAFSLDKRHTMAVCDEMIARKLNLVWGCETRVNHVNEDLLKKMRKAGCLQVDFGVESGSDDCLKRIKKGINTEQVRQVFKACKKVGIRTFANILLNTPGETEKDLKLTLNLLDEIKPTVTSFNTFTPFPGTDIYEHWDTELAPEDYSILAEAPLKLIKEDPRFRFSDHQVDMDEFYQVNHRKYNSLTNSLGIFMQPAYIKRMLKSKKKNDYLKQLRSLSREMVKQRR